MGRIYFSKSRKFAESMPVSVGQCPSMSANVNECQPMSINIVT